MTRLLLFALCGWMLVGCTALADVELPRFTPVPTIGRLPSVTPAPPEPTATAIVPTAPPTLTSTPEPLTGVVAVGANVRAGPSTRRPIVGSLAAGSEVILINSDENWYEIRTPDDSLTGWMIADVLDIKDETLEQVPTVTPAP